MERYLGTIVLLLILGFSLISWEMSRIQSKLEKIIEVLRNIELGIKT